MAAYGQAQALLVQSQSQLGQASQLLSQSLSVEGAQTMGGVMRFGRRDDDGLLGTVANHNQKKHVHDAHELALAATRAIQMARAACYDLPYIHEPDVAEMGGMIRQGIFDSTLMDAMRMSKLKGSLAEIQRSAQDVGQAIAFCTGRAAPPPNYNGTPAAYGAPPPNYSSAPAAYGAPPPNYSSAPAAYGAPPPNYSSAPAAYGAPPPNYNGAPAAYGAPPPNYNSAPAAYGAPPPNYYSPPAAAYGAPPPNYYSAPAAGPPPPQQHRGIGVGGALLAGAALAAGHDRRDDRRDARRS